MQSRCNGQKKSVNWNGKSVEYTSVNGKCGLAKILGVSTQEAKDIIRFHTEHLRMDAVLRNGEGYVDKVDLLDDNARGLLKKHFGIQRISNRDLFNGTTRSNGSRIDERLTKNVPIRGDQEAVATMWLEFESDAFVVDYEDLINRSAIREFRRQKSAYDNDEISHEVFNDFIVDNLNWGNVESLVKDKTIFKREAEFRTKTGAVESIGALARKAIGDYRYNIGQSNRVLFYTVGVIGRYTKNTLDYRHGMLFDEPDNIYRFDAWTNIEYWNGADGEDTCAVKFLTSKHPKLYWKLKKIETAHGVDAYHFQQFCDEHKIPYVFRDCKGDVISENLFGKRFDQRVTLTGIQYNGHIYPYTGGYYLKPKRDSKINIEIVPSGRDKLAEFLDQNIIPRNIKVCRSEGKLEILSMSYRKDKYVCNPDYEKCKKYLTAMGVEQYLTETTRLIDIPRILEKIYRIDKKHSFFPEKNDYKTNAQNYRREDLEKYVNETVRSFDKNKAYLYALKMLEYLIYFDFRTNKINDLRDKKVTIDNIVSHHLYWCTPHNYSMQLPETGLYTGYNLIKYLQSGISFHIKEELCTTTGPNYWTKIIELMNLHMDNNDFKEVGVIIIGCFERRYGTTTRYNFDSVLKGDEIKKHAGHKTEPMGDHVVCFNTNDEIVGIRDNFPVAIQLKNASRDEIIRFVTDNGIPDDDILAICTDNVVCKGKHIIKEKLDKSDMNGWKEISADIRSLKEYPEPVDNRKDMSCIKIKNTKTSTSVLYDQYAGGGKTDRIVNVMIPRIVKRGKTYIVLTPSHKTLQEYKKLGLVCQIIQYFHYVEKDIPYYDYYIIDEVGMLDLKCHDILYKIYKTGRPFACFGDFKQLLPFDKAECTQPHYLNFMFNKINTNWINYRNDFTKEYYDSILSGSNEYCIEQVCKHSVKKFKDAELIVCFRHATKDIYNEKMLKVLGLEPFGVGAKIVARTNRLIDIGIYNRKELKVHKINDKTRTLIDEFGDTFEVPNSRFNMDIKKPCFDHAYCINIHQVQGMTLKSYYWCSEDNFWLINNHGRIAYTIVSRLFKPNARNTAPRVIDESDYEELYRLDEPEFLSGKVDEELEEIKAPESKKVFQCRRCAGFKDYDTENLCDKCIKDILVKHISDEEYFNYDESDDEDNDTIIIRGNYAIGSIDEIKLLNRQIPVIDIDTYLRDIETYDEQYYQRKHFYNTKKKLIEREKCPSKSKELSAVDSCPGCAKRPIRSNKDVQLLCEKCKHTITEFDNIDSKKDTCPHCLKTEWDLTNLDILCDDHLLVVMW